MRSAPALADLPSGSRRGGVASTSESCGDAEDMVAMRDGAVRVLMMARICAPSCRPFAAFPLCDSALSRRGGPLSLVCFPGLALSDGVRNDSSPLHHSRPFQPRRYVSRPLRSPCLLGGDQ